MNQPFSWEEEAVRILQSYSLSLGCTAYLSKPKEQREAVAALSKAFRQAVDAAEPARKDMNNKPYDGNDLESASDYYHCAFESWSEVIRLEDGFNAGTAEYKSNLNKLVGGEEIQ